MEKDSLYKELLGKITGRAEYDRHDNHKERKKPCCENPDCEHCPFPPCQEELIYHSSCGILEEF